MRIVGLLNGELVVSTSATRTYRLTGRSCGSGVLFAGEALLIRLAVPSERLELEQLQLRASLENAGDRDALLAHPDAIALPPEQIANGRVFVAEREGTIAGFAVVEPRADGDSELDALFVDPHRQRLGIGRELIEHCAVFARKQGSSALHVVGNPHAKTFYHECGFEVIGTTETRFGLGLVMRKSCALEK